MLQNLNQNSIQSALGYCFKDSSLLSSAFTQYSFNESNNNEGLVFLGEKLLDFIISDYICSRCSYSAQKMLNTRLDDFKKSLDYSKFIAGKGLTQFILLPESKESLRNSPKLNSEVFLAILAAIYKDGGLSSLKAFILPLLRAIDGREHYLPKTDRISEADVIKKGMLTDIKKNSEKNVKISVEQNKYTEKNTPENKNLYFFQKENTDTVTPEKNKRDNEDKVIEKTVKKGVNIFKAIIPQKNDRKNTDPQEINEKKENTLIEQKRSFIRDALTPVSLPENMKDPKFKKTAKTNVISKSTVFNSSKTETTEKKTDEQFDTGKQDNYKSMLQEYIQKNIRSANVLLKYNTIKSANIFVTEISFNGKILSKAEGSIKKQSEKAAAKLAYESIKNCNSPLSEWFSELSKQGVPFNKAPENYISKLNEYFQKKSHSPTAPIIYEDRPSGERKTFTVVIVSNGEELAVGTGHTIKDARQNAAKSACEKLKI